MSNLVFDWLMTKLYARGRDSYKRMEVYDDIGSSLLLYLESRVKITSSSTWRQLSASYELVRAREKLSRAHSDLQYLTVEEIDVASVRVTSNLASGVDHLDAAVQYLKADHLEYEEVHPITNINLNILNSPKCIYPNNPGTYHAKIKKRFLCFSYKTSFFINETVKIPATKSNDGPNYAKDSKACLDKLRRFQYGFRSIIRTSVQHEVWTARRTLGVGVGIFVVLLISTPVLVLMLRNTITTMQGFSSSIACTTQRLMAEKQKSDLLLSRMLPMPVLQRLRAQKTVPAEAFDAVTIFFSDIVGFTSISANSTPMEIINMLNMLYR
ncbi:uncharacterized protein LOC134745875 [Cydia strobilella]|uniref:uncharacterized protein LOC134745875 n=1 Tax=Cydia strobilella TaxID=1100964 RepID=UPI003003DB67